MTTITGEDIIQTAEMELKQEQVESFKLAIRYQLEKIAAINKSLRFQEGKLTRLKNLTLEQFTEEGR